MRLTTETQRNTTGNESIHIDIPLSAPLHSFRRSALFQFLRNARLRHSAKTGKRVQIPRCRATVSEEIASGHWVRTPGRPLVFTDAVRSSLASQETGVLRPTKPLSRAKEDGMHVFATVFLLLLSLTACAA